MMNNVFHYTMPTSLIGLLSRIRLNENIDRSMLVKCPCTSSSATPTTHTSTVATSLGTEYMLLLQYCCTYKGDTIVEQYYRTYYRVLYSTSSSGWRMLQAVSGEAVAKH